MTDTGWISDQIWDVVIIGSGVGGSVTASLLAKKFKKILILEKGISPVENPFGTTNDYLWKQAVNDKLSGKQFIPFLGEGAGGSSRLYGMAMERLHPTDFQELGGGWPGSDQMWDSAYTQSEKMFSVESAKTHSLFQPLLKEWTQRGIESGPLMLASKQIENCDHCQSELCKKNCKIDAWTGPLSEAVKSARIMMATGIRAEHLVHRNGVIESVVCCLAQFPQAQSFQVRANYFVMAAGALRTPLILKKSVHLQNGRGFQNNANLGHYLMRHLIDIYTLKWQGWEKLPLEQKLIVMKAKAWKTDFFYHHNGLKMGSFQAFGGLPHFDFVWSEIVFQNKKIEKIPFAKPIAKRIVESLFKYPTAAYIGEDSPQFENYIEEDSSGQISINYKVSKADISRLNSARFLIQNKIGKNIVRVFEEAHRNKRLAHVCGTCRMGTSTATSVTNEFGKVHESENLWIADSSVFPFSSGRNPSLTIAAHAHRMSEKINC